MCGTCESQTSPTLLGRLKNLKDARAWSDFVHRYGRRIYGWCRTVGLQEADAEDVTQTILVKLAVRMQTFVYDPSGSFRSYLRRVTIRAWGDFLESRKRNNGESQFPDGWEPFVTGEDLDKHLDEEFKRELLHEAMARVQVRVDPKTWQVFCLLAFEDRSGSEVAQRFGMSLTAVYVARYRVQSLLRVEMRKLAPEAFEEEP